MKLVAKLDVQLVSAVAVSLEQEALCGDNGHNNRMMNGDEFVSIQHTCRYNLTVAVPSLER
jgi:hypothetical protein